MKAYTDIEQSKKLAEILPPRSADMRYYEYLLNKENQQVQQEDLIMKPSLNTKQKWSEEDKKTLQGIIDEIAANKSDAPEYDIETYDRFLTWLKSLRPQKQWKPSEKQMEALKEACDEHWEPDGLDPLYTLYQELKKLREE